MTAKLTQNQRLALRSIMLCGIGAVCAAVLSLAGLFLYLDPQVPKAETYRNVQLETPLRIFSADRALIAEFGERRLIPIKLEAVPQHFIDAILDTEDKRFYQHAGIDFISLANDVVGLIGTLITEGELGPGASTITMQLARNVSFSLERRFLRKFKEMLLALKIEQELTKDEILELYINIVPFGKRAYGAEAAAQTYYAKPLSELSLAQMAMLAGIPQAPTAGNPINGPERALARRNLVLSRMLAQRSISQDEYAAAISEPITASVHDRALDVASPYAAEWVRQQAYRQLPDLYTAGYEIVTTLKASHQASAIAALRAGLRDYDQRHGYRGAEGQLDADQLATLLASLPPMPAPVQPTSADSEGEAINETEGQVAEEAVDEKGDMPAAHTPAYSISAETSAILQDALRPYRESADLRAAIIIEAAEQYAIALPASGEPVYMYLEDTQWARPYINVDRRGATPERFDDIVRVGDIVRLAQRADQWVLSQLPEIQGAMVSLDPSNGRVQAIVGGFDFYANQYNHALQAARQPGSGFKPFVYSAAIANGVTPADIFMDAPLVFDDDNLESQYRPDNNNNAYNGPTRLREALYRSINLVSMRVLLDVGAGRVLDHAAEMGFITRDFPRNTQLAIGGGTMAITPIDMATAYAVFANGGYAIEPHIIDHIRDANGRIIYRSNHPVVCKTCLEPEIEALPFEEPSSLDALLAMQPTSELDDSADAEASELPLEIDPALLTDADTSPEAEPTDPSAVEPTETEITDIPIPPPVYAMRILDERNAFIVDSMLRDVIRRGTGVKARVLNRTDLAGKTGTTNDAADTWFNGYHPDLVTSVWVGFSNHEPLGAREFGSTTPLPIWIDYMRTALPDLDERQPEQPAGVVSVKIDPATGEAAAPGQANALFEFFLQEHAPARISEETLPKDPAEELNPIDLF